MGSVLPVASTTRVFTRVPSVLLPLVLAAAALVVIHDVVMLYQAGGSPSLDFGMAIIALFTILITYRRPLWYYGNQDQ